MYSLAKHSAVTCFRQWANKGYAAFASLHKVVKIGVVTFCCSLIQNEYQPLMAQVDSARISEEVQLDEVEITVGREELFSGPTRPIATKSVEQLQIIPASGMNDVLKHLPGVDIRQRGSDDIQADISFRGSSFDQVLILLNGVNITDPQTGHYSLDLPIELGHLEKIELLQGSHARLYGSNAFGGAINLVTLSPSKRNRLQIEGGSFGRYGGSLLTSFGKPTWQTSLSISHKHSDGYRENTDYQQSNAMLYSQYQHQKLGRLLFQAGYQQKDFGANSFYSLSYPHQFEATKTIFADTEWEKTFRENILLKAGLYERRHHDRFELFRNKEDAPTWYTNHNYHLSDVTGAHISSFFYEKNGKTAIRAEWRNEHIFSNVLGYSLNTAEKTIKDPLDKSAVFTKEKNRSNLRLHIDQTYHFHAIDISVGLSSNYHSDYYWYWYGGGDISYRINTRWNSSIQYNHAVRLPTFTDLFYSSATQIGNPSIQPETSDMMEWNLHYQTHRLTAHTSIWHRQSLNTIDWVKQPDAVQWECRNLTEIKAFGLDAGGQYLFEKSGIGQVLQSFHLNYSYQYLDKEAGDLDSKYALDYLRNKVDAELVFLWMDNTSLGHLSTSIQYTFKDRSGDYTDNTGSQKIKYRPYHLIDIRFLWKYQRYSLHFDLLNVTNTDYSDFGGLPQPGFHFKTGMACSF